MIHTVRVAVITFKNRETILSINCCNMALVPRYQLKVCSAIAVRHRRRYDTFPVSSLCKYEIIHIMVFFFNRFASHAHFDFFFRSQVNTFESSQSFSASIQTHSVWWTNAWCWLVPRICRMFHYPNACICHNQPLIQRPHSNCWTFSLNASKRKVCVE